MNCDTIFSIFMFGEVMSIKIGVYAICLNEKEFIERCFDSIKEADEIVICDTGSTDGTLEMLHKLSKEHLNTKIKSINVDPWRFDDARNVALYSLSPDIDFCISIDADEILVPGWYQILIAVIEKDMLEGTLPDRYHHRFKSIWNWKEDGSNFTEHWHERIHSRHGYRWCLPVHEHLVKMSDNSEGKANWLHDLWMIQKPDLTKSRSSYLPLMEIAAKEDPKRWKTFSFMAYELVNTGRVDEARAAIEHALQIPESDKDHLQKQLKGIK
jgi:glycosyltransferase involved in cell wall biosynthesis